MTEQLMEDTPAQATHILTVGLLFKLKREARRRDISVSALVRQLLGESLKEDTDGSAND